ncbi:unnamed protein product [Symbiodinium sp. CCMP2592]|nr:unnamed protein product [Symbiodinium sp. CCMP2592]
MARLVTVKARRMVILILAIFLCIQFDTCMVKGGVNAKKREKATVTSKELRDSCVLSFCTGVFLCQTSRDDPQLFLVVCSGLAVLACLP